MNLFSVNSIDSSVRRQPCIYLLDTEEMYCSELLKVQFEMNSVKLHEVTESVNLNNKFVRLFLQLYEKSNGPIEDWKEQFFKEVLKESNRIVDLEKDFWKVDRPWKSFKRFNIQLPYTGIAFKTKSFSYPNRLSVQSRLLARLIAPNTDNPSEVYELADRVGMNRVKLGLNYVFDHTYGQAIGDFLFENINR